MTGLWQSRMWHSRPRGYSQDSARRTAHGAGAT